MKLNVLRETAIFLGLSGLYACYVIFIHPRYQQDLFNYSLEYILHLQQDRTTVFTFAAHFFSDLFIPVVLAITITLVFFLTNAKHHVVEIVTLLSLELYFLTMLKLAFHHPRPYMKNTHIEPLERTADYGDPSGHSVAAILMPLYITFAYSDHRKQRSIGSFHSVNEFQYLSMRRESPPKRSTPRMPTSEELLLPRDTHGSSDQESNKYSWMRFMISLIVAVLLWGCVGYSRVYIGVHSIDQVLLGFITGFFTFFIYYLVIKPYLDWYFWHEHVFRVRLLVFIGILVIWGLMIAGSIFLYLHTYDANNQAEKQKGGLMDIIKNKFTGIGNDELLEYKDFYDCTLMNMGMFILLCRSLFDVPTFKDVIDYYDYKIYDSKLDFLFSLIKIGVLLLCVVPFLYIRNENPIINFFIRYTPLTLIPTIVLCCGPLVFLYFRHRLSPREKGTTI